MDSLKTTIMRRDGLSSEEADDMIEEAKQRIITGNDPEEILYEDFCLEPDYIFDLLN